MITKVLDASGAIVHDCEALGCDVSWDGYALRPLSADDVAEAAGRTDVVAVDVAEGGAVPNRADVDATLYTVRGSTARLRKR